MSTGITIKLEYLKNKNSDKGWEEIGLKVQNNGDDVEKYICPIIGYYDSHLTDILGYNRLGFYEPILDNIRKGIPEDTSQSIKENFEKYKNTEHSSIHGESYIYFNELRNYQKLLKKEFENKLLKKIIKILKVNIEEYEDYEYNLFNFHDDEWSSTALDNLIYYINLTLDRYYLYNIKDEEIRIIYWFD